MENKIKSFTDFYGKHSLLLSIYTFTIFFDIPIHLSRNNADGSHTEFFLFSTIKILFVYNIFIFFNIGIDTCVYVVCTFLFLFYTDRLQYSVYIYHQVSTKNIKKLFLNLI